VFGKSGGIWNQIMLNEFREAAKEHLGRVSFVYADGNKFKDQMRNLGIKGSIFILFKMNFDVLK